jgi:hypothetical protein
MTDTSLELIRALQRRVAVLEQRVGATPDAYVSDVGQAIGPDGSLSYDFNGHVHAQALDLTATQHVGPQDTARVRWLDAGGAVVATITGFDDSDGILLESPAGADTASIELAAADGTTGAPRIAVRAGGQFRDVINADGSSSFLQLGAAGEADNLRLTYGVDSVAFSGSKNSGAIDVAHGLGRPPIVVLVGFHDTGDVNVSPTANTYAYTATQFTLVAHNDLVNSFGPVPLAWIAIG